MLTKFFPRVRDYFEYVLYEVQKGAETAKRSFKGLDVACANLLCVSKESGAAKEAARTMVGRVASFLSDRQLIKHGIQPEDISEIREALSKGDASRVAALATMDPVEKLSISGSP